MRDRVFHLGLGEAERKLNFMEVGLPRKNKRARPVDTA